MCVCRQTPFADKYPPPAFPTRRICRSSVGSTAKVAGGPPTPLSRPHNYPTVTEFLLFHVTFFLGGVGGGRSNNTCWEVSLLGHFSEPPRAYEIGTKKSVQPPRNLVLPAIPRVCLVLTCKRKQKKQRYFFTGDISFAERKNTLVLPPTRRRTGRDIFITFFFFLWLIQAAAAGGGGGRRAAAAEHKTHPPLLLRTPPSVLQTSSTVVSPLPFALGSAGGERAWEALQVNGTSMKKHSKRKKEKWKKKQNKERKRKEGEKERRLKKSIAQKPL